VIIEVPFGRKDHLCDLSVLRHESQPAVTPNTVMVGGRQFERVGDQYPGVTEQQATGIDEGRGEINDGGRVADDRQRFRGGIGEFVKTVSVIVAGSRSRPIFRATGLGDTFSWEELDYYPPRELRVKR
jgi:hypothetical protein